MPSPACAELPHLTIQRFALYAFEIVEGHRSMAQLSSWISSEVINRLRECRSGRTQLRSLCGDRRRVVPVPGPVHTHQPGPGVVEAAVVLRAMPRSTAVALRFEFSKGRWLATEVTVL